MIARIILVSLGNGKHRIWDVLWIVPNLHVTKSLCVTIYTARLKEEVVLVLLTVCQQWVWVFSFLIRILIG